MLPFCFVEICLRTGGRGGETGGLLLFPSINAWPFTLKVWRLTLTRDGKWSAFEDDWEVLVFKWTELSYETGLKLVLSFLATEKGLFNLYVLPSYLRCQIRNFCHSVSTIYASCYFFVVCRPSYCGVTKWIWWMYPRPVFLTGSGGTRHQTLIRGLTCERSFRRCSTRVVQQFILTNINKGKRVEK